VHGGQFARALERFNAFPVLPLHLVDNLSRKVLVVEVPLLRCATCAARARQHGPYFLLRRQGHAASNQLRHFQDVRAEVNQKLKTKALKFHVAFIPVGRDQLIAALIEGRGDVTAASLTITEAREKLVDFCEPR